MRDFVAALLVLLFPAFAEASPQVEETILGPVNVGGIFTLAPAGGHAAYMGQRGDKFFMIVDGVEGPEFDEVVKAAGGGAFFPAKAGVWPGTLGGIEGHDAPVLFSRDGQHHAYFGRQGNEYAIIYDGKEIARGPWDLLGRRGLTMSPGGRYVVLDRGRTPPGSHGRAHGREWNTRTVDDGQGRCRFPGQ